VGRVVVLLGPPGSGKTSIGEALARRGFRWRDWEVWILQRWGARDEFLRRKSTALPELHAEIRSWITSEPSTAVIETTGISDAPLLDELDARGEAFVVRLDVTEEEALRRVVDRERGHHLSDEPERNRSVWRAFYSGAASRQADLTIDTSTTSVPSAAARIAEALPQ
jgi:shikimate kinase